MMVLVVLLLIIILIILLSFKSSTSHKLQQLEQELVRLRKEIAPPAAQPKIITAEEKKQVPTVVQPEPKEEWTSGFKVVTDSSATIKEEDWLSKEEPVHQPAPEIVYTRPELQRAKEEQFVLSSKATGNIAPPKPPKPTFFERNPDLEKFI